jgi:hypothetical protein
LMTSLYLPDMPVTWRAPRHQSIPRQHWS